MYSVIVFSSWELDAECIECFSNLNLLQALKLMAVYNNHCCEMLYNGTHLMTNI